MHDELIRYSLDGEIKDENLVQTRERMIHFLEKQMRAEGCVPSLDLDPQFTVDYNHQSETYNFSLSVYGVFVGGNEAWQSAGVTSGKKMLNSTQRVKSKES